MVNSKEIFDVVDENNKVIGTSERKTVHDKKLWHRSVHILIFNDKNELLLQKRSLNSDLYP